jgi:excisionase family DNA binding protein
MTVAQVATAMGVSRRQVEVMLSSGQFPPCDLKIGRLARWKVSTFNKWLESQCRAKGASDG